jgi:hypothetical protein
VIKIAALSSLVHSVIVETRGGPLFELTAGRPREG